MRPRRLFLVRHGETEGESAIRYFGSTDIALADLGRRQVAALLPLIAAERFVAVVHSPMQRALVSMQILALGLQHEPSAIVAEDAFREIDFGQIEGMSAPEIEVAMPDWYRAWQAGETDGFPGGDQVDGFHARVREGLERLLARYSDGDILVVAHKGIVKSILMTLLQKTRAEMRTWPLDLASVTVLAEGEGWQLERSNETGICSG